MMISRSCSWCHCMNPATERYCRSCSHEAHVARLDCRCPRCATARRRATGADTPVPLADLIARAITALRPGADETNNTQADGAASPEGRPTVTKHKSTVNPPDTNPTPVEWKRIPVSPELADAIWRMDDLLQNEFQLDIAYCLMARDGVVAASDAVHSYMPPIVATAPPTVGN
jgi:hypothetical protein